MTRHRKPPQDTTSNGSNANTNSTTNTSTSNTHHHHKEHSKHSKEELWKGALEKDIGNNVLVQMTGLDNPTHTVYARVNPSSLSNSPQSVQAVPIGKVIEVMVDEGLRHAAKDILEKKSHFDPTSHNPPNFHPTHDPHQYAHDSHPSAHELLKLGAVWILNETAYASGDGAHAKRLHEKDEMETPSWEDMTLRVHYMPDRFYAAGEVDWTKYCRGLLLDGSVQAVVGGVKAHVPMTGLPNERDGVIVYEDDDLGFLVLNKPGGVPSHSTISNHSEDLLSMLGAALKERHGDDKGHFVSIPLRVEPETYGLTLAATKREFCAYMTKQLEGSASASAGAGAGTAAPANGGGGKEKNGSGVGGSFGGPATSGASNGHDITNPVKKSYRCLVCIKDPDDIDRIESLVHKTLVHYVNPKSPAPKRFVRNEPKTNDGREWLQCLMRITNVGNAKFRAACVSSKYHDSNDFTLAHRLWNPNVEHPAEVLGVSYVMQLDVELLTSGRPHQMRGQLAALGCPIVGDRVYGGGVCDVHGHRHSWERMAVQCCRLEFALPKRVENEEKKKVMVPSEVMCSFSLSTAWWTEYLVDYERFL